MTCNMGGGGTKGGKNTLDPTHVVFLSFLPHADNARHAAGSPGLRGQESLPSGRHTKKKMDAYRTASRERRGRSIYLGQE